MKAVRNILVGTDFSPASRAAFRRAVELAAANEAALWIAYVGLPTVRLSPIGQEGPARDADLSAALGVDARTQLQLLVTRARQAGVRARTVPLVGVPHLALNLAARRHRATSSSSAPTAVNVSPESRVPVWPPVSSGRRRARS